jgi:hypothetical protein
MSVEDFIPVDLQTTQVTLMQDWHESAYLFNNAHSCLRRFITEAIAKVKAKCKLHMASKKVKVKFSRYRPEQALGDPEG